MKEIKNKIIAQKPVKWRDLSWLQNENLKELSEESLLKLKNSLSRNNFIQPFNVWEDHKGKLWILDGVHRQQVMKILEEEGIIINDKLPANFIDCRNKREAAKLVLIYSSFYAKVTEPGLKEYCELNSLLLQDVVDEIDTGIDMDLLRIPELKEDVNLGMVETAKNLSDVYIVVGEYRILVERNSYLNWIEDIKTKYGFDKMSVMKELKKRLKIK